ncbi:alpha/beta-hydrolase [Aulographum hederae CBS 113979]|uniref:Alpha/beta-hydrolase n=1 Tax=Aulographum hederae CBS 113979 TaxID=1176131 RepID=A0A6G1GYT0_9PEZI|nr:alpha/beta-hydrolase [Aulographum hederae CBS 113979]
MVYRVLCLHGSGTNAAIFASQTAAFRNKLPKDEYKFFFFDGPVETDAEPGLRFPGPYFCWYNTPTSIKWARAQRAVYDIIEKNGPFDCVMGFSQGAAVPAAMMLEHSINNPSFPPLFRGAIFLNSTIPFSTTTTHGLDIRTYFGVPADVPARPDRPSIMPEHLITDPGFLRAQGSIARTTHGYEGDDVKSIKSGDVHFMMWHHTADEARIGVPTAHFYGRRDRWKSNSLDLLELCSGETSVYEHEGGHEVPRDEAEAMAKVMLEMFERSAEKKEVEE